MNLRGMSLLRKARLRESGCAQPSPLVLWSYVLAIAHVLALALPLALAANPGAGPGDCPCARARRQPWRWPSRLPATPRASDNNFYLVGPKLGDARHRQ